MMKESTQRELRRRVTTPRVCEYRYLDMIAFELAYPWLVKKLQNDIDALEKYTKKRSGLLPILRLKVGRKYNQVIAEAKT